MIAYSIGLKAERLFEVGALIEGYDLIILYLGWVLI